MIESSWDWGYMKVRASWSCMTRIAMPLRQILSIAVFTMSARLH